MTSLSQTWAPNPFFANLDAIPPEVRIMIWEATIKVSRYHNFRLACRQIATESSISLIKYGTHTITVERSDMNGTYTPLTSEQIKKINYLDIELTKEVHFREHWIYQELKDDENLIDQFYTRGLSRAVCQVSAETLAHEDFQVSEKVMNSLLNLRDFETVIFQGEWRAPSDIDHVEAPKPGLPGPFWEFKTFLEMGFGPGELLSDPEDPVKLVVQFHPHKEKYNSLASRIADGEAFRATLGELLP